MTAPASTAPVRALWPLLTAAEAEVAALLALGATCTEIARARGRSLKTVDCQRLSILRKLELRSTTALARWALRAGLVAMDDDTYERAIPEPLPGQYLVASADPS